MALLHVTKTTIPLLWRVVVFLCAFVLIASTFGPRIISGGIMFRDGFAWYGGIGKAFIFGLISFALLARHSGLSVTLRPWRPLLLGWVAASAGAYALAWSSVSHLLVNDRGVQYLLVAHTGVLLSMVFALFACFGLANVRLLWSAYKRQIIWSAAIAAAFYGFLLAVYALWRPLAGVVLFCVKGLVGLAGLDVSIVPPNTLVFDKFGVTIAEYCSGVESIALFTGLYVIVGLLDWQKLDLRRYIWVFPLGLLGLLCLNVLRVFGLIMAGYYINPQIAFSLFHTYAGMIFFIVYSIIFWSIAYRFLLRPAKTTAASTGPEPMQWV